MQLPNLKEIFPFEYKGGGYYRRKNIPKNVKADILHGNEAIEYLYKQIEKKLKNEETKETN